MGRTVYGVKIKGSRGKFTQYIPHPNPVMEALESAEEESRLVDIITAHLLTSEQKIYLLAHNLRIDHLLNGRYPCGLGIEIHERFFSVWNAKLGKGSEGRYFFSEKDISAALITATTAMLNPENAEAQERAEYERLKAKYG